MRDKLIQLGINALKWASRHHILPVWQVKVETTKLCNLKCVGCRRNFAETLAKAPGPKHLTVGELWRIVATTNMQIVRFEGDGEPTCNPNFRDLVKFCYDRGIRSAMTCNGTLLDKEYINWLEKHGMVRIHISFDGSTKETFEKQRVGAKYEQVLEVCREIGKSKIQLFMNIVPSTEDIISEMLDYVDLCKEIGATGILPIKFQADKGFGTPIDWNKHQGLLEEFKAKIKEKGLILASTATTEPTFHECEDAYVCPYVTLDGSVYACAYMANMRTTEVYMEKVIPCPSRNYVMGNLNDNWMRNIWKNDAYKELRRVLRLTRKPNGHKISRENLLALKNEVGGRFQYCAGCLCRWGETGL
jgi:MoaA/NifB/PqqE/SkfB family radical SAM enzyme